MIKIRRFDMTPIYDYNCNFVAHLAEDGNFYDNENNWIGFTKNNYMFSAETLNWLGTIVNGVVMDKNGKVFGWLKNAEVKSHACPITPLRPLRPNTPTATNFPPTPIRPIKPAEPDSGWSTLSWEEFMRQNFYD